MFIKMAAYTRASGMMGKEMDSGGLYLKMEIIIWENGEMETELND